MNLKAPARLLIPLTGLVCLWPQMTSAMALAAGLVITLVFGNPFAEQTKRLTPKLLSLSVIGLGAGMQLHTVAEAGWSGLLSTAVSLSAVLAAGLLMMRAFRVEAETGILITAGTAICGGSAIAAVAPVIHARPHSVSIALGCVFILNAAALLIFPYTGHLFELSQPQFGLWSALAIHDTSSVVGATLTYGSEAAHVGTTVKLVRALWIVPLTLAIAFARRSSTTSIKKPWFIAGFVAVAALVTFVPELKEAGQVVELVARRVLVLTLFLIGLGLSKESLRLVGWRPFVAGFFLWFITATASLFIIKAGWL